MRRLLFLALLLPAGCSLFAPPPPPDLSGLSPDQACDREAESDKRVRELRMLIMTDSNGSLRGLKPDLERARRDAKNLCLAGHGIIVPGGVQRIDR